MDRITQEKRSWNMSRIKARDTKPEMLVRRFLWAKGFRYRRNVKALPGTPDIVLRKLHTVIFINGCFWHGHNGCKYYTIPKTRTEFWQSKIKRNIERDEKVCAQLKDAGWNVITVWECDLKKGNADATLEKLTDTLSFIFLQLAKPKCYAETDSKSHLVAED